MQVLLRGGPPCEHHWSGEGAKGRRGGWSTVNWGPIVGNEAGGGGKGSRISASIAGVSVVSDQRGVIAGSWSPPSLQPLLLR